jgi:glycogen operon protein
LEHPNLHRRKFYQDRSIRGSEIKDIVWLRPDGQEMTDDEWTSGWVRCLGVMLNGQTLDHVDEKGDPVRDDTFVLMLNCHHEPIKFYLPPAPNGDSWEVVVDTNEPSLEALERKVKAGEALELVRQSLILVCESRPPQERAI